MDSHSDDLPKGWLKRQLREVQRTVRKWPKWKRDLMQQEVSIATPPQAESEPAVSLHPEEADTEEQGHDRDK